MCVFPYLKETKEFFVKVWCLSLHVDIMLQLRLARKFHISLLANGYAVEDVTHHQFYFLL